MKNYPQWDRMDDFLKQHRGPKKKTTPKWGRRLVVVAIIALIALILTGVFGHSHSASSVAPTEVPAVVPVPTNAAVPHVAPVISANTARPLNAPAGKHAQIVSIQLPNPVTP